MSVKSLIACVCALGAMTNAASAAVIGSYNAIIGPGTVGATSDNLNVQIGYAGPGSTFAETMFDVSFTSDSVFTLESGSDFDAIVALMTNGVNNDIVNQNYVRLGNDIRGGVGGINSETSFLFNALPGDAPVDLSGYLIERFVLTIMDVEYLTSTNRTEYSFNWRLDVYGVEQVPIPAAAPLFLAGLGFAGFVKRKRKN